MTSLLSTPRRCGVVSRASAVLVATGLTLAGTVGTASAAEPPSDVALPSGAVPSVSGFVAGDLAANNDVISDFGYTQHGPTIDAVLALAASGAGAAQAEATTAALAADVEGYIGAGAETYTGATGKLLTLTAVQGGSATDFGGVNLVERLRSTLTDEGRFVDQSEWGDYSNTLGQSWGIIGLERAAGGADASAVEFLRAQQCADGGFRLYPETEPCASNPDATGIAVQALVAAAGPADTDVTEATAYLAGLMDADGGIGGEPPTDGVNANSTGLAAGAFTAAGDTANAERARAFLASLYLGCTAPQELRGAIAYDAAALAEPELGTQLRMATGQAAVGLAGQSYVTVSASGNAADPVQLDCSPTPEPQPEPEPDPGEVPAPTGSLGFLGSLGGN